MEPKNQSTTEDIISSSQCGKCKIVFDEDEDNIFVASAPKPGCPIVLLCRKCNREAKEKRKNCCSCCLTLKELISKLEDKIRDLVVGQKSVEARVERFEERNAERRDEGSNQPSNQVVQDQDEDVEIIELDLGVQESTGSEVPGEETLSTSSSSQEIGPSPASLVEETLESLQQARHQRHPSKTTEAGSSVNNNNRNNNSGQFNWEAEEVEFKVVLPPQLSPPPPPPPPPPIYLPPPPPPPRAEETREVQKQKEWRGMTVHRMERPRQCYTRWQILELEMHYENRRYISKRIRPDLAEKLALTERQVKNWFQNRRMKDKKESRERTVPYDDVTFPVTL